MNCVLVANLGLCYMSARVRGPTLQSSTSSSLLIGFGKNQKSVGKNYSRCKFGDYGRGDLTEGASSTSRRIRKDRSTMPCSLGELGGQ